MVVLMEQALGFFTFLSLQSEPLVHLDPLIDAAL